MKSTGTVKRSNFSKFLFATGLRLATILISGCAATSVDQVKNAPVLFERMPSEDVVVSEVHAVEDADGLIIHGKVKRTARNCCDSARGHVDIAVVGPDGAIVDMLTVAYSPRNIPKGKTRSARFTARLPYKIPAAVPLRVTYHNDRQHAASATGRTDDLIWKHNLTTADNES